MFKSKRILLAVLAVAVSLFCMASLVSCDEILGELGIEIDLGGEGTKQSGVSSYPKPEGTLEVHTIDVGQGDAILLYTADGCALVDTSYNKNSVSQDIIDYIKSLGISKIDMLVLTHPHADHIGGAPEVIEAFEIGKILMPDKAATTKIFEETLDAIEKKNIDVYMPVSGDVYDIGELHLTVLAPNSENYGDEMNNYSIVLRATFGSTSFMLTGDAEEHSESEILAKYSSDMIACDVLKVGHHGSTTSSSEAFLDAVKPKYAVISCGEGNDYGHPHAETISKLKARNIEYFITTESGTVVFVSNGEKVAVRTEK